MEQSLERTGRLLDLHGLGHVTLNQLTGGVFLTGFLLSLGSSAFLIGVVAALPLAAKLSQLYTSWQIERRGSWERTTRTGALWGRLRSCWQHSSRCSTSRWSSPHSSWLS